MRRLGQTIFASSSVFPPMPPLSWPLSLPFPLVDILEKNEQDLEKGQVGRLGFSLTVPIPFSHFCPLPAAPIPMSLPLSQACVWYCQEADLPLTTRAIQRLHPSNFLLLGSSSAFLCLNLMYYLISLSAQNCLPGGYLLSVLSGKEFGVVGLTPDSASGKLRPNGPSIFLSPGSGASALRLCSAGLQTQGDNVGQPTSALPHRQFQCGLLSFLNPSLSSPRNRVCPPSEAVLWTASHKRVKDTPGKPVSPCTLRKGLTKRLLGLHYDMILPISVGNICWQDSGDLPVFSTNNGCDVCLTVVCDPFCRIFQRKPKLPGAPPPPSNGIKASAKDWKGFRFHITGHPAFYRKCPKMLTGFLWVAKSFYC